MATQTKIPKQRSPIPRVDYSRIDVENAIKQVPLKDWQGFFESIRLEIYQTLKMPDTNAETVKQNIRASIIVEGIFTAIKA